MTNLREFLASNTSHREVLRYGELVVSGDDLQTSSARVAAGLKELGIGHGDRVAIWLPNIPAWLEVFFACAQLGAIAVSVNTRFRAHEVADIVTRSAARALVLWPDFHGIDFAAILADVDDGALAGLEHIVVYGEQVGDVPSTIRGIPVCSYRSWQNLAAFPHDHGKGTDRCVIFTTSGTTRAPKFVCHIQNTVVQHARDVATSFGLDATDARVLQALPLCGVFGFTQALAALAGGAPMTVMPVFDGPAAARLIREQQITHTHGVDDMIASMLAAVQETPAFPTLRHFGYAAFNPALDNIIEVAQARGLHLRGLYGMSECHALYAVQPADLDIEERRKGGGRTVSPHARVRVRDPDSGELLPPGARGEIEISGPSLLKEYFADREATAAALTDDGFLRTGDLGYLEADGRFCYLARMGDVLRLGGFLTSPLEIESVIDAHAEISASQVIAVESGGRSRAFAFAIASSGVTFDEDAVIEHCKNRLAGYKVPARIFPLEAFPTTLSANGTKIQKARLRDMALERLARSEDDT
mgnify:CR=1 FL=1|jgi:fatty-acyl-CoA synthase